MRPIRFSKKELGSAVLAAALALASLRPADPWVFIPTLGVSWLACAYLAYYHEGRRSRRFSFVAVCTLVLASIGFRNFTSDSASAPASENEQHEIAEIDSIFAGRDEIQLRAYFGFTEMVDINIALNQARRIHYTKTGNPDMDLTPFIQGREMQLDIQYSPDRLQRTESGFNFHPDINTVPLIVLPAAYSSHKKDLFKFENSSVLPAEASQSVRDFDRVLQDNVSLLQRTLNIAMMQDPNYFVLHGDTNTRYYHALEGRFWTYFHQLRPIADKIRDTVRNGLMNSHHLVNP